MYTYSGPTVLLPPPLLPPPLLPPPLLLSPSSLLPFSLLPLLLLLPLSSPTPHWVALVYVCVCVCVVAVLTVLSCSQDSWVWEFMELWSATVDGSTSNCEPATPDGGRERRERERERHHKLTPSHSSIADTASHY